MNFLEKIKAYYIYLAAYLLSVFLTGRLTDLLFFKYGSSYLFIILAVIPIGVNFTIAKENILAAIPASLCCVFVCAYSFDHGDYNHYSLYVDYIGLSSCALVAFLFMRLIYKKGRKFGFFRRKISE
ncbi:hypothetical protein CIK00_02900 [Photobacterium carnosum]|uniref:Uncharacterized protein n=1 Tax=Photobacterium carnosum TaxID=2023717 RepID=A0A2N4UW36_9GAMM|nr:hypothetical protein CIK00_02900 [Photobacterium carnosum]